MDPISIALALATKFVPEIIGHFAGSKAGDVAGKVVEIAQAVTGTRDAESAQAAILADPAKALEFQKAVMDNKLEIDRLALEETKAYLTDVQSARTMQVAALDQDDQMPKRFLYNMSAGILLFAAVYIFWITFGHVPPENIRVVDTVLGFILGTLVAAIVQFFYGSSQGSVKSSQALRDIARAKG